jgi:hypothetical protein
MFPLNFPLHSSMATDPSFSSAHKEWSDLASIADVLTPTSTNRADFIKESQGGAFDGVVAAYRTFLSVSITGLIDEELVSSLPKSLKYLCHNGTLYFFRSYILNTPLSTGHGGAYKLHRGQRAEGRQRATG